MALAIAGFFNRDVRPFLLFHLSPTIRLIAPSLPSSQVNSQHPGPPSPSSCLSASLTPTPNSLYIGIMSLACSNMLLNLRRAGEAPVNIAITISETYSATELEGIELSSQARRPLPEG